MTASAVKAQLASESRKGEIMQRLAVQLLLWLAPWLSQAGITAQQPAPDGDKAWLSALQAIVESERAFARSAGEKGTRDAFLAFIAEDAVLFRPQPVPGKKYLLDHPASPGRLSWRPVFADVSISGDFGYTTGPYEYRKAASDPTPSSFGNYFTIWQKQADGAWRFVIDYGTANPEPAKSLPDLDIGRARSTSFPLAGSTPEQAAASLIEFELKISAAAAVQGNAALGTLVAADARFFRAGRQPAVGLNEISSLLAAERGAWTWVLIRAGASIAGDLGYTYGTCLFSAGGSSGASARNGCYLRVYSRQPDGTWKIRADVTNF
jgi:ketosteroid isomerase-like protein